MQKKLRTLFHPERFQGWGKSKRYFEGWYFKVVSHNSNHIFAFIPGISYDKQGHGHAFIQVLDGRKKQAEYIQFPMHDFSADHTCFKAQVGENRFSTESMVLNLETIQGELLFENVTPWPNEWYSPGIMGPYTFVPFMECKHGIVSLHHKIRGSLMVNGVEINFDEGTGYIEKDWGISFPSAYVWMQTNHFESDETSLKLSVAKIPWLGNWFVGFIGGVWHGGKLYEFTSYNGTKLQRCSITDKAVELELESRKFNLQVSSLRDHATHLAAPILGDMSGRIQESMTAKVQVLLKERKGGRILFSGEGNYAGFEVAGAIESLIKA